MIRPYSASAVRLLARQSLSPAPRMGARRMLSRSAPLRNNKAHGHERPATPTGGSSDLPWILGAVGFTIPASWYLLTAGSPAPKHSDPHAPMDTASTSPGFHVQKNVPEHHQELTLPGQSKSEADELPQNQVSGEEKNAEEDAAETELRETGNRAASGVVDRARDTAERAAGQAQGVAEEASEAVSSASEKASATASGAAGCAKDTAETASETAKSAAGRVADVASNTTEGGRSSTGEGDEGRLSPLQKTSKNPQKSNPGDTAMEDAGSFNTTSGKQQGSSNDDSRHAVPHEPQGDAILKKPEGMHDPVDVNRPVK